MAQLRRLLAVVGLFGITAIISSSLQGQQGKKATAPTATPQSTTATEVSRLAEASDSRFGVAGMQIYQPLNGDAYFAMPLQPKLDKAPDRPRDIVIVMSTTATVGGPSWIASHQIAEGIIESARENDRVSLWTANEPKYTTHLTGDFLLAKDFAEGKRLRDALARYRAREYPAGDADLKDALAKAVASFDATKDRQRILLFLGDGLSTHNPMSEDDRQMLAMSMVERQIAFFPVPLGIRLNPNTLHGLANSTGGIVLRTRLEDEKLVDALKRYDAAFAAPVLYAAKLQMPANVIDVCPSVLPPLRIDSPTLVVGRLKRTAKQVDMSVTGMIAGRAGVVKVDVRETVLTPNLDNYFLVNLVDQWSKAKTYPAVLRADRALTAAYVQTRLQHQEHLESAQIALEENKLDAAGRHFEFARRLSPHDGQAAAGITMVDRLKDGTLNRDVIRKAAENRARHGNALKFVDGKPHWVKVDLAHLPVEPAAMPAEVKVGVDDNLLKGHRDRLAIEEQKISNVVDDAIRHATRNIKSDPDGAIDMLRGLLMRVKDHPDLAAPTRDGLFNRLQAALQSSASQVKAIKLAKQDQGQALATAQSILLKDHERKSFEDRVDAQFRVYKNLMQAARVEEYVKREILEGAVQIQNEARLKGYAVPVAAKAMYDVALAAQPLQLHNSLIRKREENWLALQMGVEKAHIPYPDEPFIHFPPLVTWKALIKARKDKYEVSSLPDDPEGRAKASEIYRLLQQTIDTRGLHEKVKLKTALEFFSDKFGGKLPILVDQDAFSADLGADAPNPYEEEVSLPAVPSKMVMNTALRLILSQVGKGNATYLIRREFVEITTSKRYLEDKVIRIYPVGDLVIPINGGAQGGGALTGGFGIGGGAFQGGLGGGFGGGFGGGGFGGIGGGFPGAGFGGVGGGFPGGVGGFGGIGGGFPGGVGGFGGIGGGFPGAGFGGVGGGFPGGVGGFGGGGFGGSIGGFQGSFNGSLGAVGATQAVGLIDIVTRIVDPGNWNRPPAVNPAMFPGGGFGFPGGFGMFGGMMMGGAAIIGAGAPPDPTIVPPDPTTSNSIDFFPPALSLIVRAPSRMHTSITGGIIGGRAKRLEVSVAIEREAKALAAGAWSETMPQRKTPDVKVAPGMEVAKKEKIDPTKVWNESFAKGGATAGHVIATADFLFESGEFKHAAELLKANLRYGVIVRPWVFEALAVALEASGGDPDEIRRVRLSGIALDPADAQGFMSAARAMADRKQFDRAIAYCKQAAELEPSDSQAYEVALAYAENAKDSNAMEWAFGNLVGQDWPVDNIVIQQNAKKRLAALTTTLKADKRTDEATRLESALQRFNQRDLVVQLVWANAGDACELEMQVKEPTGNVCSVQQKQSPGGGLMIGFNLIDKEPSAQYIASQAFSGAYEITVSRVYGQPVGNRARLIITENAGTPQQTRRIETVEVNQKATFTINLKEGRRTELATVSPAAEQRKEKGAREERDAFNDLRAIASANFVGATTPRGSVAALASKDRAGKTPLAQNASLPTGNGVQLATQVRPGHGGGLDLVIRPFFQAGNANRAAMNLSVIPGGSGN